MNKLKNLLCNTVSLLALAVLWVFYAPYAICKALIDIETLQDFADDILTTISNLRFRASRVFRRRSTHNKVVAEIMKQLKAEARHGQHDKDFLSIYHFIERQYK